jgi:hypothetical protein
LLLSGYNTGFKKSDMNPPEEFSRRTLSSMLGPFWQIVSVIVIVHFTIENIILGSEFVLDQRDFGDKSFYVIEQKVIIGK